VTQQQRRPEGVDLKSREQLGLGEIGKALFRHEIRAVQHAGSVDDQVEWPLPRHRVRGPFDADRIGEVQRRFGPTTERDHRRAARVGLQGSDQRRADAAGSADDQRAKSWGT